MKHYEDILIQKNIMKKLTNCPLIWVLPSVTRLDVAVVDIGPPADWVKINVQKTVSFSIAC